MRDRLLPLKTAVLHDLLAATGMRDRLPLKTAVLHDLLAATGKIDHCPVHGEHCKSQPLRLLVMSHAGIPAFDTLKIKVIKL